MTHHDDHIPGIAPDVATLRRLIVHAERATVIGLLVTAGLSDELAGAWYDEARRRLTAHIYTTVFADPPPPPAQPIWGPR